MRDTTRIITDTPGTYQILIRPYYFRLLACRLIFFDMLLMFMLLYMLQNALYMGIIASLSRLCQLRAGFYVTLTLLFVNSTEHFLLMVG